MAHALIGSNRVAAYLSVRAVLLAADGLISQSVTKAASQPFFKIMVRVLLKLPREWALTRHACRPQEPVRRSCLTMASLSGRAALT